jgi:hypothetical protein
MNRLIIRVNVVVLIFAFSLFSQEETSPPHDMSPPAPLDNAFMKWMVGEWKGETTSAMGMSSDYMKFEMALNGQFMIMNYKGKMDNGQEMTGMGVITEGKDGKLAGYWIDSWRTMSEGQGVQHGSTSKMEWATNKGPYVRTTEKVDENTMKISGVMPGPDGKEMKSVTELKRVVSKK